MKTGAMLPLAVECARYVGEPVVALAAASRAAAEDAAALVRVEYEPLPAVLDPEVALAPGAPLIHGELGDNVIYETRLAGGDPARAFASAPRTWRRTFRIGRHTGVPIEPRSLVADYEPATRALTLWISSQVPHMMQAIVSDLFGLPEQRVRVVAPDVGGSFGIKIHVYQDDLAACALALVLGRPVKWVATRRESFLADIHAREQTVAVEVAADADGTLTAMRAEITAAVGPYSAYPRSSVVEGGQVLRLLPGPYRLRHYEARLRVIAQNKGITSQYRAVGHPIATAVTESMVELIARDLGLDPAEVRRRNLVRPDEFPFTSVTGNVYDSGSYQAALETLLLRAGYEDLRREQRRARAAGHAVGIGLACFVELTGRSADLGPGGDHGAPGALGGRHRAHGAHRPGPGHAHRARPDRRRRARRARRVRRRRLGGHRGRAVRRRDVGEPRHADRRQRDAPGRQGAPRARDPRGGRAARGPRGGRRAGRRARDRPRHRQGARARRPRADRPLPFERAPRRGAEPRGHGPLHEPRGLDLHQRGPPRGGGARHRDGARERAEVRRGGRLRPPREPGARGRPGAGRRRAGDRRRALGALRLRRGGAASDGDADGLCDPDRGRSAADRGPSPRDASAGHRGRLQGRGRGRDRGRARGDPERRQRCARPVRRDAHRAAGDGRARAGRAPRRRPCATAVTRWRTGACPMRAWRPCSAESSSAGRGRRRPRSWRACVR